MIAGAIAAFGCQAALELDEYAFDAPGGASGGPGEESANAGSAGLAILGEGGASGLADDGAEPSSPAAGQGGADGASSSPVGIDLEMTGIAGTPGSAGGPPTATCTARPASFRVLDTFAENFAAAVSADGRVVVGSNGSPDGRRAFRWAAETGMQNLGALPGSSASGATAVSANGSVVVGVSATSAGDRAFRWTAETGMQDLGVLPTGTASQASAVSADGSVVAGSSTVGMERWAFRWTGVMGMQALGVGDVQAMSGDGAVIVGYGGAFANGQDAFRWTALDGMRALEPTVESQLTSPRAISSDGRVIVGDRLDQNGNYRATRWVEGVGATSLPVLPVDTEEIADAYAAATNADGSTVVGRDDNGTSSNVLDAFVWTEGTGSLRVVDRLPADTVGDWLLFAATGVSGDGRVIVGDGSATFRGQSQAWVADLGQECP